MNHSAGFVKLSRCAICSPCFQSNPHLLALYVHLCAMARWRDNCTLKAGQLVTSKVKLAQMLCVGRTTVLRLLVRLEKENLIIRETSKDETKITIIGNNADDEKSGPLSGPPSGPPQKPLKLCNDEYKKVPKIHRGPPSGPPSGPLLEERLEERLEEIINKSSLLIPETETAGRAIELAEAWNCTFPQLRQVTISILRKNEPTKKTINAAIKRFGYDHILASFELIKKSPWLMSRHDDMGKEKKWLDLLWVLKPSNYQNIWDEKYLRAVPITSTSKEKWL